MSSYYLHTHACDHRQIKKVLDTGIESECFKAIRQSLAGNRPAITMLSRLFRHAYSRDPVTRESPYANALIAAFEEVCAFHAPKVVIEFYLDEDRAPEMWSFSFGKWDVADDFGLPFSPDGTPSVIYRNTRSLNKYLATFRKMLANDAYDHDCLSQVDLKTLIKVISAAVEKRSGLFMFCRQ